MGWGRGSSSPSPSAASSYSSSSSATGAAEDGAGERCATRRVVTSSCRTEEVDGRLIRKCEKTEKLLRECVGRPAEVVESTTEHTEDDVTDRPGVFGFPGLRSDVETIQQTLEGGLSHFLQMAEEMTGEFFGVPWHRHRDPPPPVEDRGGLRRVMLCTEMTSLASSQMFRREKVKPTSLSLSLSLSLVGRPWSSPILMHMA
ncbi:unnamed protein product [Spirodela intermedia]|uniref:Uncharacterized protein n=1 Tax=Spirodela intermedia TaxID=51605 RepID=A0A7I8IKN8_SPIIN|nr:unnamed protein product [Spirodela intermedia]CAA6658452.1 unnamed protein product [Spirodela intermedia]